MEQELKSLTQEDCKADPEQIRYADTLFYGAWLAIAILVLSYFLYVSGLIEPKIPLEDIPTYWSMSVDDYLAQSGAPTGWSWVSMLGKGDYLNFAGVVLLAGMTILCFAGILAPAYYKKRDKLFLGIVVLECVILCFAASNILGSGGH